MDYPPLDPRWHRGAWADESRSLFRQGKDLDIKEPDCSLLYGSNVSIPFSSGQGFGHFLNGQLYEDLLESRSLFRQGKDLDGGTDLGPVADEILKSRSLFRQGKDLDDLEGSPHGAAIRVSIPFSSGQGFGPRAS